MCALTIPRDGSQSCELLEVENIMQEEVKASTPLRKQADGKQFWASTHLLAAIRLYLGYSCLFSENYTFLTFT